MLIDAVRDYIKTCPLLESDNVNVNYLEEIPDRYSIKAVACEPILKNYTDGSSVRQFLFFFASRELYDADVLNNLETAQFYEAFAGWLEEQNAKGILPVLGSGLTAQSIGIVTAGSVVSTDTTQAKFQIKCKLIYKNERN